MAGKMRIISLAPTQTEILAALGLLDNLVGVTENCDYPEAVSLIPCFGSWYAPDLKRVANARPDLVLTFGERQEEAGGVLAAEGLNVYHSDPGTIDASLETFIEIALLTDRRNAAEALVGGLRERLNRVKENVGAINPVDRPGVLRIMHWDPLIAIGPGAFQYDVVEFAGGRNVMSDGPAPYFVCNPEEVVSRDPDVIFFCEPFIRDMLAEDPHWKDVGAIVYDRVFVFDCGLTCRSGPRIVDMTEQLAVALWPDRFAE